MPPVFEEEFLELSEVPTPNSGATERSIADDFTASGRSGRGGPYNGAFLNCSTISFVSLNTSNCKAERQTELGTREFLERIPWRSVPCNSAPPG